MPDLTTRPLALTLKQAADLTPWSEQTLRRAIHATDPSRFPPPLPAKKPSGAYVVMLADLERWLQDMPDA